MKRSNKEINIFSMSALDLFASALGAFILIAIVLFPYFPNIGSSPEKIAELRAQLNETRQQLQACQEDLAQTRAELQQCSQELRKKFLLIVISWGSRDDIDLHVIDPQGNEFYFAEPSYPGTEAKLEEDNIRGPGNEIWLHPKATPGEYKIYYKLYSKITRAAVVRGSMLTPNGSEDLPTLRMTREGQKKLVAVVTIDNDGNAVLQVR